MLKMNIADIEVREKSQSIIMRLQKIMDAGEDRFLTQHRKKNGEIIDVEASANYANYLGGFIFLGFNKKKSVGTQDLEFLDVFAMHASTALAKAGVLK